METIETDSITKGNEAVVVYTDGACRDNGGEDAAASLGVFSEELDINFGERLSIEEQQTNGRAEIKAMLMGIKLALQQDVSNIKIKSDSKYVVNGANRHVHV